MKLKISCFNFAVMKKDLKWLWITALMWFGFLFMRGAMAVYQELSLPHVKTAKDRFSAIHDTLSMMVVPFHIWVLAGFCIAAALISFSYLYDKRANQMIHAMPITRNTLFFTHFFDGLMACLVPVVLNMLLIMPVLRNAMFSRAMLTFYGYLMLATVLFYSFAVLMCMLCGVLYLPPFLFLIFMELYAFLRMLLQSVLGNVIYGFGYSSTYYYYNNDIGKSAAWGDYLSPLNMMSKGYFAYFRGVSDHKLIFYFNKGFYWYLPAAAVLVLLAWWAYKKRPLENWGDFLVKPWLKVFFSIGITGCVMAVIYTWIVAYEKERHMLENMKLGNVFLVGVTGFVAYLVVSMIIRKTVHVKKKIVMVPAVLTAVGLLVGAAAIQFDFFGIANWIPDEKNVEACELRAFMEGNEVRQVFSTKEIIELHKQFLEEKDYITSIDEESRYDMDFSYHLKDGRVITRNYELPYSPKDIKKKGSLWEKLVSRCSDYHNVFPEITKVKWKGAELDHDYENGECVSQSLLDYPISLEEIKEAILADIEEGTLRAFYIDEENMEYGDKEDKVLKHNTITIPFKFDKVLEVNSIEFGRALYVNNNLYDSSYPGGQMVIPFTSKCKHIMEVLKKAGFTEEALANRGGVKFQVSK